MRNKNILLVGALIVGVLVLMNRTAEAAVYFWWGNSVTKTIYYSEDVSHPPPAPWQGYSSEGAAFWDIDRTAGQTIARIRYAQLIAGEAQALKPGSIGYGGNFAPFAVL